LSYGRLQHSFECQESLAVWKFTVTFLF